MFKLMRLVTRRPLAAGLAILALWAVGGQLAEQSHSFADEPASPWGPPRSPGAADYEAELKPVVRAYAVAPNQLAAAVAELKSKYAGRADVRIASDVRTSQLLLVAPEEVQLETAAGLGQVVAVGETPAPPASDVGPSVEAKTSRYVHPLQNASWREVETALQSLGSPDAPQSLERNGEVAVFRLRSRQSAATVQVDRRNDELQLEGPETLAASWAPLASALDQPAESGQEDTKIVPIARAKHGDLRRVIGVLGSSAAAAAGTPAAEQLLAQNQPAPDAAQPGPGGADVAAAAVAAAEDGGGLIGPVQVEFLEGLDIIIIRGNRRDVERVTQIINEIEQLSTETQPAIEIHPLKHVDGVAMVTLINQLYEQSPALRQTRVSLTALGKPNALLLIGRAEGVKAVQELIEQLDQPVEPSTQFRTFYLKHTAAASAQTTLTEFFTERPGLGTRVRVSSDVRSNALIVQASPRDIAEIELLLARIDVPTSEAVNELRVFPLQNSLASELAPVLQAAIVAQDTLGAQAGIGAQAGPGQAPQPAATGAGQTTQFKSTMLRFMTIDAEGQRQIRSGILTDVKITADPRANALVVSAPAESMDLLAALIRQLDQIPAAEAQIKVFTIVNGDAASLVQMLETLFGTPTDTGGGGGFQGGQGGFGGLQALQQPAASAGESTLVALRFSVDQRTNSIVASGSSSDLGVVEAILLRLDDSDVRERQSVVYRLKNAPALDVATAINEFLSSERQVQQIVPGLVSPFEQIAREVVVVPETVSNSLIVSATPRYFAEIRRIVEQLDAQPPLVIIQVMLAEVAMNNIDEFGIELGLQDSVLFDRSVIQTITGGAAAGGTQLVPGFNFNNQPLGNSDTRGINNSNLIGGQGLSDFALGRTNSDLGFGGLVLSASSESVSVLLRALNECRKVEVLSRPQITTLDNQPAYIQVGQRVPRVTSTNITQTGQVNSVELENVGLILGVTPRISPDGLVVMEIDAERSELSPEPGVPISIAANGDVLFSPIVNTITAQTTVSALSGQTIVLGGLITKNRNQIHRRVPVLSDVPVLGNLFRYDFTSSRRTELLIIMTPRVIRSELDADIIKQVESSRMSWCLADVVKVHGPSGLRSRSSEWTDGEVPTVYPDLMPHGLIDETGIEVLPEGVLFDQGQPLPSGDLPAPLPVDPGSQLRFAPPPIVREPAVGPGEQPPMIQP